MSLPAFSAIIASYVPNHGNLGPSGSYNAWVNKINTRKNACNSWATCTNTPDDIWNVRFSECDEGCSAQGDDKCVSNFCDALADVYDYTRRLGSSDVVTQWPETERLEWPDVASRRDPAVYDEDGNVLGINGWIYKLRNQFPSVPAGLVSIPLTGCPAGCEGSKEKGVCSSMIPAKAFARAQFCAAVVLYSAGGDPERDAQSAYTPAMELEDAYEPTVELTEAELTAAETATCDSAFTAADCKSPKCDVDPDFCTKKCDADPDCSKTERTYTWLKGDPKPSRTLL